MGQVLHYRSRVTAIDSVSVKMQIGKFEKIKNAENCVCSRGEIDKLILHKKPRK
jgi:hypothetical protein